MPDFLENFDLSRDPLNIFLVMNLLLLQNLDRNLNNNCQVSKKCIALAVTRVNRAEIHYLFASEDVSALLDLTKCSLSKRFSCITNKLTTIILS